MKWVILWHFGECLENDINLNSIHDTEIKAKEYLEKIKGAYGKSVVFTILGIPIDLQLIKQKN